MGIELQLNIPRSEAMKREQEKSVKALTKCSRGPKAYDNQTEEYNEIGELLIETGTTGMWVHVCYQDRGWRVSVTMAAVHMGRKEMGVQT